MKTMPIAILGGLITSACWAAPSGHLNDNQLVISGIPAPLPVQDHSATLRRGAVDVRDDIQTPAPHIVNVGEKNVQRVNVEKRKPTGSLASTPPVLPPITPAHTKPTTFFISANEAPYRALSRWLQKKNLTKVAFSLSEEAQAALLHPVSSNLHFTGTLPQSIEALGQQLDMPLRFDVQRGIAAIHTQPGMIDVRWVHGRSLKEAIANLTRAYQWHWREEGERRSWMSEDDYPLMAEYGIVTPRGAFDLALDTVLEGYPVRAELIPGSRQIFIRERQ